jgi:hypothetical protein
MAEYDDLAQLIEVYAARLVATEQRPIEEAQLLGRQRVTAARQQYRDAGAIYGDTGAGFLLWILERND